MLNDPKTILYRDYQIDISSESLENGNWRALWWIWISDEATRFFTDDEFSSEAEAMEYAEKAAKLYIDLQTS